MRNINLNTIARYKSVGRRFSCLTAYDSSMAAMVSEAEIDIVLVGDSLGMVVQGHDSTLPVTLKQMVYHTEIVARASTHSMVLADLPFMSYSTPDKALESATALIQAGADMVKLEGNAWLEGTIRLLTQRGIPVCAHLGLTPQWVKHFGGYRVQGRSEDSANQLMADAQLLQTAGARIILLECIPHSLAQDVTQVVTVPTIGIGCGRATDGQVLVSYDVLGLTRGNAPSFVKNFLIPAQGDIEASFRLFKHEVEEGLFPDESHQFE